MSRATTTTATPATQARPTSSGSEVVLQALVEQGVDVVFGYPGGAVLPIYDAIFKQDRIRHILVRHEQGALHAAEGYARSSGKVGVVLVTSGPGATNTVTGLTDALMDSVPVVCLTGQVPTHMIGNDAFQEADTSGITRPCTKHNYLVKSPDDLARVVHEAFHVARSGRPGPVVIDLPKDILMGPAPYLERERVQHRTYNPRIEPDADAIERAVELMAEATRPVFYVGGGVINAGDTASEKVTELVRATGFPVTLTPDGAGGLSGLRPPVPGHARYARHLRGQSGDARLRSDDRGRVALRRSGDRTPRPFLAGFAQDPHRHRSQLDQQERAGRSADRRRCRARGRGLAGALAGARQQRRSSQAGGLVAPDRRVARQGQPALPPERPGDQAAVRDPAPLRADQGPRDLHHDRGRSASDVGGPALQVRAPAPLDDLGRPRHHGLRFPLGDGGPGGPSRRPGDRHRRRGPPGS